MFEGPKLRPAVETRHKCVNTSNRLCMMWTFRAEQMPVQHKLALIVDSNLTRASVHSFVRKLVLKSCVDR